MRKQQSDPGHSTTQQVNMSSAPGFVLTMDKFLAIAELNATKKRSKMHHIMKKSDKKEEQRLDLEVLNASQAFVGAELLKGPSLDRYEEKMFELAEEVGNAKSDKDRQKVVQVNRKEFPVANVHVAEYQADGNNIAEYQGRLLAALAIVHGERKRIALNAGDMTHEETMAQAEDAKKKKADRGKEAIVKSTSGEKKVHNWMCHVGRAYCNCVLLPRVLS
jgi:hypothetical protein